MEKEWKRKKLFRLSRKTNKLEQTVFFDAAKANNKRSVFTKIPLKQMFPIQQIESSSKERNPVARRSIWILYFPTTKNKVNVVKEKFIFEVSLKFNLAMRFSSSQNLEIYNKMKF